MSRMSGYAAKWTTQSNGSRCNKRSGSRRSSLRFISRQFLAIRFSHVQNAKFRWRDLDSSRRFQKFQGRVLSFGPSRYALAAQPELQDRVAKGMVFNVEDLYVAIQHRFTSSPCQAVRGVNLLIPAGRGSYSPSTSSRSIKCELKLL